MRVNIFDNGLRSATGHHFDYSLNLARSLTQRGHSVSVWGALGMPDDVIAAFRQVGSPASALFSHFTHDHPAPDGDSPGIVRALADKAAHELAQTGMAELSLFPTLTALQLAAWSQLERAGPMTGLVHVPPDDEHPASGMLWLEAAERARTRGLQAAVAAIDPVIGSAIRRASDALPVFDWPMPLDGTPKPHYLPQIASVGFFGHQREERGILLIPPLARALLDSGCRVLIHDTMGQFQSLTEIPNLVLINGFVRNLSIVLAQCDLVVCTMQPEHYARRTSGIACSAVASGIPLVLPSGTLSAARYDRLESVVCYHERTVPAVLDAVAQSRLDYPRRCLDAQRAALDWRQTQGVEKFVDAVLAALPLPTQSAPA